MVRILEVGEEEESSKVLVSDVQLQPFAHRFIVPTNSRGNGYRVRLHQDFGAFVVIPWDELLDDPRIDPPFVYALRRIQQDGCYFPEAENHRIKGKPLEVEVTVRANCSGVPNLDGRTFYYKTLTDKLVARTFSVSPTVVGFIRQEKSRLHDAAHVFVARRGLESRPYIVVYQDYGEFLTNVIHIVVSELLFPPPPTSETLTEYRQSSLARAWRKLDMASTFATSKVNEGCLRFVDWCVSVVGQAEESALDEAVIACTQRWKKAETMAHQVCQECRDYLWSRREYYIPYIQYEHQKQACASRYAEMVSRVEGTVKSVFKIIYSATLEDAKAKKGFRFLHRRDTFDASSTIIDEKNMAAEAAAFATAGQTITCNAAVAYGAGEPFVVEKIQVAPPQDSEVRLKITHTSFCRTDLTFWRAIGQNRYFPRIFGHEAAGIVESVGKNVTSVKPGDHAVPLFTGECQSCGYCKSGKTNLCEELKIDTDRVVMRSDGKSRFSKDGNPISHFVGTSTFSEYTVVEEACVARIDDKEAPLGKICLLSCGLPTGVGAALNTAKVQKGSTVAIFGLGTIGFAVAQGAKIAGASRIIGVDVLPAKLEQGKAFGLTDGLNPKDCGKPIDQVIKEMTNGGVDYAFECVGNVNLIKAAVDCCHEGWGKAVVTGLDDSSKMLSVHPNNFLFGRTLPGTRTQLNDLVTMYMNKELQLDEFITHTLPLSKINDAFQLLIEGKCLRCVLHMDHQD